LDYLDEAITVNFNNAHRLNEVGLNLKINDVCDKSFLLYKVND